MVLGQLSSNITLSCLPYISPKGAITAGISLHLLFYSREYLYTDNSLSWHKFSTLRLSHLKPALKHCPWDDYHILICLLWDLISQARKREKRWVNRRRHVSGDTNSRLRSWRLYWWRITQRVREELEGWRRWAGKQLVTSSLPQWAVHTSYYSIHHLLCYFSFSKSCSLPLHCRLEDVDPVLLQESNIASGI